MINPIYISGLEFKSIQSEVSRTYDFGSGLTVTLDKPMWLNVSASGGHRVITADETSHYIPAGWLHLLWKVKEGLPAFEF